MGFVSLILFCLMVFFTITNFLQGRLVSAAGFAALAAANLIPGYTGLLISFCGCAAVWFDVLRKRKK